MRCKWKNEEWCIYNVGGMCYYMYSGNNAPAEPSESCCGDPHVFGGYTTDEMLLITTYDNEQLKEEINMAEFLVTNVVAEDERRISEVSAEQVKDLVKEWLGRLKKEEKRRASGGTREICIPW